MPTDPYEPVSTLALDAFVLDNLPPSPIFPGDPYRLGEILSQDYLQTDFVHDTVQFLVHGPIGPDTSPFNDYFLFA